MNDSSPAIDEKPAAEPATQPSENEDLAEDAAMIERNKLLAEIDARYAPRPAEMVESPAAADAPNVTLAISLSLGLGFVTLLAAMFLVLRL